MNGTVSRRNVLKMTGISIVSMGLPVQASIPKDEPLDRGYVTIYHFGDSSDRFMDVWIEVYQYGKFLTCRRIGVSRPYPPMEDVGGSRYLNKVGMVNLFVKGTSEFSENRMFPGTRHFLAYPQHPHRKRNIKDVRIYCQLMG